MALTLAQFTKVSLITLALGASVARADDAIHFSVSEMAQWSPKIFAGETRYQVLPLDGEPALLAQSDSSGSALGVEQTIDLLETPYINWRWRVADTLPALAEQTKAGDDYVARVYVVFESGFMGLGTKAMNYVWSSQQSKGRAWNNAFAGDKVKMLAVQDAKAEAGQWYFEKRNVYADMIAHFGDKGSDAANQAAYRYADVLAIMTDTDNSGLKATAYYGPIHFSAD